MSGGLYLQLSLMMFLEFAVWGAWSPVLAARLLGPLKMSGKQVGWVYATIPLASIIAPLVVGQLVDKWINMEWFLVGAHLVGAVLLLVSAKRSSFGGVFGTMGLYALCYAPTLALVPALMFRHLPENAAPATLSLGGQVFTFGWSTLIFIWAPVSWAMAGWALTAWRKAKGTGSGGDCLVLAGILSVAMAIGCMFLPATPPKGASGDAFPFLQALSLLKNSDFLVFLIASFVLTTQLQFYYLGTAQYLQDLGVESRNVPASMAIAQAAQAVATLVALDWLTGHGFRVTLATGAACWLGMYLIYSLMKPRWLVISSQALHGLAYVFFIIGGQIYVGKVAPASIQASAQALLQVATIGLGLFLGTQFTGAVMDRFRTEGRFNWRTIYLVPCTLTLVSALALLFIFRGTLPNS